MHQRQFSSIHFNRKFWQTRLLPIVTGVFLLLSASPAMAHHAMDSRTPSNFFEGFLSGLAHPLIGPDHFAFVVAVGLLAAVKRQGIVIPIALILSAMLGSGLHLLNFNLPGAELFVSGSILLFGILLIMKDSPNTFMIMMLAAIAGVFHGYAYGESIFGAEMSPIFAYLLGFTTIQAIIATSAFVISKAMLSRDGSQKMSASLRSAGLVLCGIGGAFLSSQLINVVLPLPKA